MGAGLGEIRELGQALQIAPCGEDDREITCISALQSFFRGDPEQRFTFARVGGKRDRARAQIGQIEARIIGTRQARQPAGKGVSVPGSIRQPMLSSIGSSATVCASVARARAASSRVMAAPSRRTKPMASPVSSSVSRMAAMRAARSSSPSQPGAAAAWRPERGRRDQRRRRERHRPRPQSASPRRAPASALASVQRHAGGAW
jgi:hypothetical protein